MSVRIIIGKKGFRRVLMVTILILPFLFQNIDIKASLESHNRIEVSNPRLFSISFGGDFVGGIATDSFDNIIVVGYTSSDDFPTLNASYPTFSGPRDAFIAKFSPFGDLVWSTFLGGLHQDLCYDIAVDSKDNIVITGYTNSSDFPAVNPYNASINGNDDVFVAKFSPFGDLVWSTYFGGSNNDHGIGIGVDSFDNIIIAGYTDSSDFPAVNASDSTFKGYEDAFVAKFSPTGMLEWSTLLGGQKEDHITDITIDSHNKIVITGNTFSSDFPTLNAFNDTYDGNLSDAFAVKLDHTGELEWSTFLGGSSYDFSSSIAVDHQDSIIITGYTSSSDFPTVNAYNNVFNSFYPSPYAFVTKFSSIGTIEWSTFLGGSGWDYGIDVAVDSLDNILVTGSTDSHNFPVSNGFDSSYNKSEDGFITKFTSSGTYKWSSFFGGDSDGDSFNIAIDSQDYFIISGVIRKQIGEKVIRDDPLMPVHLILVETDCFLYHMLDPLLDTDNDSLPDYWEYEMDFNPSDPLDAGQDFDSDGLTNLQEFLNDLDPKNPDYDGDGALDGEELGQVLLDPKSSFFNPVTRIIILFFIIVLPGIAFIFLSFRWKQEKLRQK